MVKKTTTHIVKKVKLKTWNEVTKFVSLIMHSCGSLFSTITKEYVYFVFVRYLTCDAPGEETEQNEQIKPACFKVPHYCVWAPSWYGLRSHGCSTYPPQSRPSCSGDDASGNALYLEGWHMMRFDWQSSEGGVGDSRKKPIFSPFLDCHLSWSTVDLTAVKLGTANLHVYLCCFFFF